MLNHRDTVSRRKIQAAVLIKPQPDRRWRR